MRILFFIQVTKSEKKTDEGGAFETDEGGPEKQLFFFLPNHSAIAHSLYQLINVCLATLLHLSKL